MNKKFYLACINIGLTLFLLAAAYFAVSVYNFWTVDYVDLLKSAAVLTSPEVSPKNEGRLVVIKGSPRTTKGVNDKEYHHKFDTPCLTRDTEKYVIERDTGVREWKVESSVKLYGGAKLGSFVLDDSVLDDLPKDGKYTDKIFHDKRVVYRYAELPASYTIIGRQQGHCLTRDFRIKLGCVFKGSCNVKQMIAQSEGNYKHYRMAAILFFFLGISVGAYHWIRLRKRILSGSGNNL